MPMDSYQPSHQYMRPPQAPPSMAADPHHQHHHPLPPPGSWFSGQFQYHPPQSPSPPPPLPPPPQQHQWGPPPPPYPAHPNAPYHPQPYPPPPPHPSYPQPNQDWLNANWSHHSGWEYPGNNSEEDWAARARAWASTRSAMENQHPQSQFSTIARQEDSSHCLNQYPHVIESHHQEGQQTSISTSSFQNYQAPVATLNRLPIVRQPDPASVSGYAPDGHFSFTAKDGALGGDVNAAFSHHQGSSSSVHQQEVPSSYSSVPGKEEDSEGRQPGHLLFPSDSRAVRMQPAQFAYGNHSLDPMDQPLDFAPRFSHENDPNMKSSYPDSSGTAVGTDSFRAVSSLHAWTSPVASGVSYPPITPAFPSAQKHDPSMAVPPLPGQPAPMFGQGPSFQPAVPSITPVGMGAGTALHLSTAFPVDAYVASLGSERPKKAAVPNWLREEIIKKKASITSSVPENSREETQSIEDESFSKSTGKSDQEDSRHIDSSRSTEEEDDEDYEEARRTAAINQEIKRVLTEVLSKVTDELFDEIATKVLSEDDLTADGKVVLDDPDNHVPNNKGLPPPPVPAPKASAKFMVPVKGKESKAENANGESSSGLPGNVLGLANYASDDDDDDEKQTSSVLKSDDGAVLDAGENGHRHPETEECSRNLVYAEADLSNGSSIGVQGNHSAPDFNLNGPRMDDKDLGNGEDHQVYSRSALSWGKKGDSVADDGKSPVKADADKSIDKSRKASVSGPVVPAERHNSRKSSGDDSQDRDARRHEKHAVRSSSERDITKEIKSSKETEDEKAEDPGRREERHQKMDKAQEYNSSKERPREKTRESDSRKRAPHRDDKDSKKERERDKKAVGKDDANRKSERKKDEKGDKSRHKSSSDRGSDKRRRSSSVSSRGKQSEESPEVSNGSVGEASKDSRRKVHLKRRNLSPSPIRSKRRQVSQSPHSKHTQRRHSPYSSLENSRGRRSRSRSPVRRHR